MAEDPSPRCESSGWGWPPDTGPSWIDWVVGAVAILLVVGLAGGTAYLLWKATP